MKNTHRLRITMFSVVSCLFLSVSCIHSTQDHVDNRIIEELENLDKIMGDYLKLTKNFVWEIEDIDYIDSIYNLGNILIEQIGNQQIDTSTLNYLIRRSVHHNAVPSPEEAFAIQPSLLSNAVYRESAKQKIRLLQITFLAERLELILLTHFQCEAIGLYPVNRKQWPEFKVGGTYDLDFVVWYSTLGIPAPVAIINGDTLINNDGPIYTYTFQPTQKGKMNFNRKISAYRWGEVSEFEFLRHPIEVEVK